MDREWNDSQPIYRQLRDRVVDMILDGVLKDGDPLPSVRNVAAEFRVNPLTVLKSYQELVDQELVEKRRGLGMFVKTGARDVLLTQAIASEESMDGAEPAAELIELTGEQLAKTLARKGVRTRDDLADLAVDELVEMAGVDEKKAAELIMDARKHWFAEEAKV